MAYPAERNRRRILEAVAGTAVAAMLCGCSLFSDKEPAPPVPSKTAIELTLVASDQLNPDLTGRPSPVAVRIHQLKESDIFNNGDFFSVYDQGQKTLGTGLVNREDLVIAPGANQLSAFEPKPEVRFIGIVAAFRDIENANWRAIVPVTPQRTNKIVVRIDAKTVTASVVGLVLTGQPY